MSSVLVLGLGRAGMAAARHAATHGDDVCVYAGVSSDSARVSASELEELGARVVFDSEDVEGTYDLCVASPGISQNSAFYRCGAAHATELIGECEYAYRLSPHDWLAITGTNGKTTTTALTAHLLSGAGLTAFPCGNIGDAATGAVDARKPGEALVVEMSSYALASTSRFNPVCAVLLNITPDHLAWHGSLEAYSAAKLKVFANMGEGQTAVVCDEVPDSTALAGKLRAQGMRVITVGSDKGADCAFENAQGMLCLSTGGATHELCASSELLIKGKHNVMNALAAASAAVAYGADYDKVGAALTTFSPLEHRIEPCGVVDGVAYYNDSKATNVDATLVALKAFPHNPVIVLFGGRDKGTDLSPLVQACAESNVKTVITYGEAGERFHKAFEGAPVELESADGMRDAFAKAHGLAQEGDVVLLSPACASFDEFSSFNHRGEVFKGLVRDLES